MITIIPSRERRTAVHVHASSFRQGHAYAYGYAGYLVATEKSPKRSFFKAPTNQYTPVPELIGLRISCMRNGKADNLSSGLSGFVRFSATLTLDESFQLPS